MALAPGARLGAYEVITAIGAGGMGEVWRAHDTKLNRDVAVKVLPDLFAADPERLARFEREAQVLAALNHPNIAHIYGLEHADGIRAIVMELVEGPTLADRIARGPIGLDEALPLAKQIAEALEAAHEHGIIHRDLKPANIKVREDGTVKVLDFGLAKALAPDAGSVEAANLSQSPTITSPAAMTGVGVLLGTAAYLSPEQAKGRAADKRSDVWAFGCVLYEMLTGKRAFEGDDISDTLAAILRGEPDWTALPADTPASIRRLLRRCMEKERKRRLPDLAVARLEFDDSDIRAPSEASAIPVKPRQGRHNMSRAWAVVSTVVALAAVAFGAYEYTHQVSPDTRAFRTSILLPPNASMLGTPASRFALSPDGRRLAFVATGADGRQLLWVRKLEGVTAQPLTGTEGATYPCWSPDSQLLAFGAGGKLRKIDPSGGLPTTLSEMPPTNPFTWSRSGVILFATNDSAILRVAASGGQPTPVTSLDPERGEVRHSSPLFLPDDVHFLYVAVGSKTGGAADSRAIYLGSLNGRESRTLVSEDGPNAKYASGYFLFLRGSTLMAQPFDADRLALSGQAAPLADQLVVGGALGSAAAFSVAATGVLAYQTGSDEVRSQLVWFDRSGKAIGKVGDPGDYTSVELSPDGTRAAVSVLEPSGKDRNLWLYDLVRGVRSQFTFDAGDEDFPVWSPDSTRIAYAARRAGGRMNLYQKPSSGAGNEEALVADSLQKYPWSWAPDGHAISYSTGANSPRTGADMWILSLGKEAKPVVFLQTPANEAKGRFSPNGRWVAYVSNELGRNEVYVAPFPGPGGKWRVSTTGGDSPRWRKDGKELFFVTPDSQLMAAAVNGSGTAFEIGAIRPLFEIRPRVSGYQNLYPGEGYDVSPDGERFLVNERLENSAPAPITLLVNWTAALKK